LAIQDTTELNFTHHPDKKGMGYTDSRTSRGLKVHMATRYTLRYTATPARSVFCASSNGVPLGIINQQVWARDISTIGKKHSRHKKETKDKESQRWLDALSATEAVMPSDVTIVTVADCEADIYDFLAMKRRERSEVLIRAYQNRSVKSVDSDEVEKLSLAIRQVAPVGKLSIELQKTPERKARSATLILHLCRDSTT